MKNLMYSATCGMLVYVFLSLVILPVQDSQTSQSVSSYGMISINKVQNPSFTDTLTPWNAYPNEINWWNLDYSIHRSSSSVRVDLPPGTGEPPVWSHLWNVRIPIDPGQRVKVKVYAKTGAAKACLGIDFWSGLQGSGYMRGLRTGYIRYHTEWVQLKLERDSDIDFLDDNLGTGQKTSVAQPGEKAVIIWVETTKDHGDGNSGEAWFDNAELYIITNSTT